MSDNLCCKLVHDEEKDLEALTWNKEMHMKQHQDCLKDALRLRPGLVTLPEFGRKLTLYWKRNKKPSYVGLFL